MIHILKRFIIWFCEREARRDQADYDRGFKYAYDKLMRAANKDRDVVIKNLYRCIDNSAIFGTKNEFDNGVSAAIIDFLTTNKEKKCSNT